MKLPAELAALHKLRVSGVLRTKQTPRDRKMGVWNHVVQTEIALGTQFIVTKTDRTLYVVLGATNEILPMPPEGRGGDRLYAYINQMYGLEKTEPIAKAVYSLMRLYAIQEGLVVEPRRFAAYNRATSTTYLSTYDGLMWKLDGSLEPKRVPSGEDEIFFINDDRGVSIEADIGPHDILLKCLTSINFMPTGLSGITAELQQKALIVWLFALAFPDLMPTKPLLILEGAQGAGKTMSIQLIQLALTGNSKPMTLSKSQENDFGVLLLRSPIALLDNIDTYIDWVADKVCSYATNGEFPKRKLYSDDEEVSIKPHAFIAVASKNPSSFRREDTADRCIVLRLDRREGFKRAEKLMANIESIRSKLFGEYLYYVNRIVEEIRAGAYDEDVEEAHRMADFSAFARVVACVMDWPADDITQMMEGLQDERDAFASEEDPLSDLLNKWLAYRQRGAPPNIGREVSIHQLFQEIDSIAQANGIQWYKAPRQLSQKIRSSHITRDFIVQQLNADGRKTYRIWRKTDAQLSIVPDDPDDNIINIEEIPKKKPG